MEILDYEGLKHYDECVKEWAVDNIEPVVSGKIAVFPRSGGIIEIDILGRASGQVGDSISGSDSSGGDLSSGSEDVSVAAEALSDLTNVE